MERRDFLKTIAAGAVTAAVPPPDRAVTAPATAALASPARAPGKRPNIIVILADDMGFSDLGCYGSEIPTPNIDGLARSGVRFTQFYNNARCCPSRASILTGLYPHQAGIGLMEQDQHEPGYSGELNNQCVTLAEALRPSGYRTLMCGKWHVAHNDRAHDSDKHDWPLQRGFERYWGTIIGAGSYYDPAMLTDGNEFVEPEGKNFYYTDALGDHAVKFIGDYANKPEPFFLYAAFTAPHCRTRRTRSGRRGGWRSTRRRWTGWTGTSGASSRNCGNRASRTTRW